MDLDFLFKSEDMTNKTLGGQSLSHAFHRLLSMPLYQKIIVTEPDVSKAIKALRIYGCRFDRHCPECNKSSTWERLVSSADIRRDESETHIVAPLSRGIPKTPSWMEDFTIKIACTRNRNHIATFYFIDGGNNEIIKVGQYPSLVDFQKGDIDHLEVGFSKEQKSDFIKAINTMAHGFNVAACVYLRRVFESIITETKIAHMQSHGMEKWDEFDKAMKVNEQITLLREDLPKFMSENPTIYRLLSKGVHELTEEECAEELPLLKKSIEVIISDRIEQLRAKMNRDELTKMIAQRVDHHENK